ncbi:MAG: hypothetical protein ACI9YT_000140 [Halobacteriales archaeon]|jgi:hypothetical protein
MNQSSENTRVEYASGTASGDADAGMTGRRT